MDSSREATLLPISDFRPNQTFSNVFRKIRVLKLLKPMIASSATLQTRIHPPFLAAYSPQMHDVALHLHVNRKWLCILNHFPAFHGMDKKSTVPFTLLGVNQKGSPGWKTWLDVVGTKYIMKSHNKIFLFLPLSGVYVNFYRNQKRACVLFAGTKAKVISESPAKCHHWLQVLWTLSYQSKSIQLASLFQASENDKSFYATN